jgi:hypothetical protein
MTPLSPLTRLSDGWSDFCSALASEWWPQRPETVLLRAADPPSEGWARLASSLNEAGVAKIGVTQRRKDLGALPNLEEGPQWFFSHTDLLPGETHSLLLTTSFLGDTLRHQKGKEDHKGIWTQTLEGSLANRTSEPWLRLPPRLSPLMVPNLSLDEALNTPAGRELLQGATVILETRSGHLAPVRLAQSYLSDLTFPPGIFHALSTDMLQRKLEVFESPLWLTWLVAIVLAIGLGLLQRPLGMALAWPLTALVVLIWMLADAALLIGASVHLPLAPALCLMGFSTIIMNQQRWAAQQTNLQRLLLQQSAYLSKKVNVVESLDREETWQQMAQLCQHLLDFHRSIFLHRISGDHRLREIVSIGSSIDDIQEVRRDFEREPYKTVIKEGVSGVVTNYLKADPTFEGEEIQILSPLLYDGEVVGFWAIGVKKETFEKDLNYMNNVNDLSAQLSRLVIQRDRMLKDNVVHESEQGSVTSENERAMFELSSSVRMLMERIQSTENLLESLSSGVITYNVFGHVEHINRNMRSLMQNIGFQAYNMTLLDLLKASTGREGHDLRDQLRDVIVHQQSLVLPATALNDVDHSFHLHLVPLGAKRGEHISEASAFRVTGVLCELIDLTEIKSILKLKDVLFNRLYYKLKNDLELYTLCADMLSQEVDAEELPAISAMLNEKVEESSNVLDQTKETLHRDIIASPVGCFPVEVNEPITNAMSRFEASASKAGLSFERNLSELISLALASPSDLDQILGAMLKILIDDAIDDSSITIEIHEMKDGKSMYYQLSNEGMGMPPERFKACLLGEDGNVSREFHLLHSAMSKVTSWGGDLQGESELGQGIQFKLQLQTVI